MPWRLFQILMPNTAAFQAITKELKEMKDEANREIKQLRKENEALKQRVEKLEEWEMDCHKQVIPLLQENRDLRERLIFLTRGKPDED